MKIAKNDLFRTPETQDEIVRWIELHHDPMERLHLATVMMMTWNFLAEKVNNEQTKEVS